MDWIKIEKTTVDKPEVHRIAQDLNMDPDMVLGKLIRVWSWLDGICDSCHASSVTIVTLDRVAFYTGFAKAMAKAGWLEITDDGVNIPNFDRHMSKSAKTRALSQERQRVSRSRRDNGHTKSVTTVTESSHQIDTREEKRREESYIPKPLSELHQRFVDSHAECGKVRYENFIDAIRAVGLALSDEAQIEKALDEFIANCSDAVTFRPKTAMEKFKGYLRQSVLNFEKKSSTPNFEPMEESPTVKRAREEAKAKREKAGVK